MKALTLLLVDDKLMMRRIQSQILQAYGHYVQAEDSGDAAIQTLQQYEFDLVLMDMNMPDMDGLQTTQKLRSLGIITPVIALTGNDSDEARQACQQAGMNGFIHKPIRLQDFHLEAQRVLVG